MSEDRSSIFRRRSGLNCTCGWDVKLSYGVAFTLAVFEAKRLLVLALEIFAEWQVIRFAGGTQPVALTLAEVTIGLPCALVTVRTIRRRKLSIFCPKTKRVLRCLLMIIAVCVTMNIATLASIGYRISVRRETIADVFNASMQLYIGAASYKYAIDEIQFVLQCCGHTSYTDWFLFDWQKVDYASGEEISERNRISDEEYRARAVPFSCCNLHATTPCVHTEMTDDKTINVNGCAKVISPILLRIVIVAYIMTGTLIVIQALLAFLITKMICKVLPLRRTFPHGRCSVTPFTIIKTPPRTYVPRFSTVKKSVWHEKTRIRPSPLNDVYVKENRKAKLPTIKCSYPVFNGNWNSWEVAKIKPSIHEEHRISVQRLNKRAR